ncbi:MAG TPA: hypothetical protein VFV15_03485 [Moraxellaceae bacterium]|nr:hypothetical protein [Moraxellaceae bacterium]
MRRLLLALCALTLSPALWATEPLQSMDALESDIRTCLLKPAAKPTCFQTILSRSLLPGFEKLAPIAMQMDDLLVQWLDGQKIFAVHLVKQHKAGTLFEKRTYIIEDTSGSLMVMKLAVLRQLGKPYIFSFNLVSGQDEAEEALDIKS